MSVTEGIQFDFSLYQYLNNQLSISYKNTPGDN